MDNRNMEKGMDIVAKLLAGEEICESGENSSFYQEYNNNAEVYDFVHMAIKRMNLAIYEYNNGIYITGGQNNTAFGYSNEQLRHVLGIRLNRELYLVYFVIYNTITEFYKDTMTSTYVEYVRVEDVIANVDAAINGILDKRAGIVLDEVEENSFKQLALSWEELPTVGSEPNSIRAAKGSKAGFVKMVFNFLVEQRLLMENQGRFYPTNRFRALIENYFDDYQSRLAKIMEEVGKHAAD